jgi:hypothetical protein
MGIPTAFCPCPALYYQNCQASTISLYHYCLLLFCFSSFSVSRSELFSGWLRHTIIYSALYLFDLFCTFSNLSIGPDQAFHGILFLPFTSDIHLSFCSTDSISCFELPRSLIQGFFRFYYFSILLLPQWERIGGGGVSRTHC